MEPGLRESPALLRLSRLPRRGQAVRLPQMLISTKRGEKMPYRSRDEWKAATLQFARGQEDQPLQFTRAEINEVGSLALMTELSDTAFADAIRQVRSARKETVQFS